MRYRFLGTECSVLDRGIKLDRFGQAVDVDEDLARIMILGNAAIIPEKDFQEIGFTAEELSRFALVWTHSEAPESFLAKKRAALIRYTEIRQALVAA